MEAKAEFRRFDKIIHTTSNPVIRLVEAIEQEDSPSISFLHERIKHRLEECFVAEAAKPDTNRSAAWEVVARKLAALRRKIQKIVICKDGEKFKPLVIEALEDAIRLAHAESAIVEVFPMGEE